MGVANVLAALVGLAFLAYSMGHPAGAANISRMETLKGAHIETGILRWVDVAFFREVAVLVAVSTIRFAIRKNPCRPKTSFSINTLANKAFLGPKLDQIFYGSFIQEPSWSILKRPEVNGFIRRSLVAPTPNLSNPLG